MHEAAEPAGCGAGHSRVPTIAHCGGHVFKAEQFGGRQTPEVKELLGSAIPQLFWIQEQLTKELEGVQGVQQFADEAR